MPPQWVRLHGNFGYHFALPQLAVWDFWRGFARARARGIFLRESLSKVAAAAALQLLLL